MANEVVMPRLGWTMETGQVVQWLKHDGDMVAAGDILFEVEGDKAITEVEALDSGVLRLPPDSPEPGVDVPVGAVLAYLVAPDESPPFAGGNDAALTLTVDDPGDTPRLIEDTETITPASTTSTTSTTARPDSAPRSTRRTVASPRARRIAATLGIDWAALHGSGTTGRVNERDVRAAMTQPPVATPPVTPVAPTRSAPPPPLRPPREIAPRISPLARRAAANAGVDVAQLTASAGGRIVAADIEAARSVTPLRPPPVAPATEAGIPLSQMRRVIGARMAESAHTAAPVTLTTEADATALAAVRAQLTAALTPTGDPVPTYTDLFVRLTALALMEHPALNATLHENGIVQHAPVHIGVAVDTERGLLVPVVRDAEAKSVGRIAAEAAAVIARTRAGKATADDLSGGTFTITNLGMYEIDAFTPIINLPECAILGVGRIVSRPVVTDEAAGTVGVRKMMALSLTFDHRVVDGAPAARFLQRIKQFVEQPFAWLAR